MKFAFRYTITSPEENTLAIEQINRILARAARRKLEKQQRELASVAGPEKAPLSRFAVRPAMDCKITGQEN